MKILHVVVNLDYGGVESYAVRISRALVELGHDVAILSQGGPVENQLAGSGVGIIRSSLKPDNIPAVARKIGGMDFDIINGHNYNGGRVGQIISHITGVPHIMTVHGPRPFIKRVLYKHWSEKIITISSADKRGITGLFGINPSRVYRSFLPVDTDAYHPAEPREGIIEELTGSSGSKIILHVSRFTNRKARVALELLNAMPEIIKSCPQARCVIIGSGECFDRITRHSAALNSRFGEISKIEQPRLGLSELFNAASVVVATATSAMEALASGTPLIAAGRTGYLGRVSYDGFDAAHDLLFADHGKCPKSTTSRLLAQDIANILSNETSYNQDAVKIARKMMEEFTPAKAAQSLLRIYEDARGEK